MPVSVSFSQIGVRLAWRRCMNCVKRRDELRIQRKRISLNEPQRIMRLGINIHPDNFKSRSGVTDASAAGAAK